MERRRGTADVIGEKREKSTDGESSLPLSTWLERLAGAQGSPGGGAACAVMVAVSSALMEMVAGYSTDDARVTQSLRRLIVIRTRALETAEIDSRHSSRLGTALREASADDDSVRQAALTAAESVLELSEAAESLIPEFQLLLEVADKYLMPDLVVAAASSIAALNGAAAMTEADIRLAAAHPPDDAETSIHAATKRAARIDEVLRRFVALRTQANERL